MRRLGGREGGKVGGDTGDRRLKRESGGEEKREGREGKRVTVEGPGIRIGWRKEKGQWR